MSCSAPLDEFTVQIWYTGFAGNSVDCCELLWLWLWLWLWLCTVAVGVAVWLCVPKARLVGPRVDPVFKARSSDV